MMIGGLGLGSLGYLGVLSNSPTAAAALLVGESDGMAFYGNSLAVKDSGTPDNDYDGTTVGWLANAGTSTVWVRNSSGIYHEEAADIAHFHVDPTHGLGLLVEPAATNLFLRNTAFDDEAWTKNTGATVNANATTGPDGTLSADRLIDDAGGGGAINCFLSQTITVDTSTVYTVSLFAKADQLDWVAIYFSTFSAPGNVGIHFDLTNGVVGTAGSGLSGAIQDVGNGWFRCSVTTTTHSSDTAGNLRIYAADADADFGVSRDGTSSIFLWGAQFETGPVATSPIPTAGSTVTRATTAGLVTGVAESFPLGSAWSIYAEAILLASGGSVQHLISISDGTTDEESSLTVDASDNLRAFVNTGTNDADVDSGADVSNSTLHKIAARISADDVSIAANGGSAATPDGSVTLPSGADTLTIGGQGDGSSLPIDLPMLLKKLVIVPSAWSDEELAAKVA